MQPPNDVRNFVHKRIGGAFTGFLTGGIGGAATGFITGGGGGRPSTRSGGQPVTRLAAGVRCPQGQTKNSRGVCATPSPGLVGMAQRLVRGGASGFEPAGPRFGANAGGAYEPMIEATSVRRCFPGDVLGRDGFCYARTAIKNSDRMYPKGRKPLGTPGELAALSKAASFGRRMETTVKRMQKIGVLKKPAPRKAPKQIGPGGPSHHHHGA